MGCCESVFFKQPNISEKDQRRGQKYPNHHQPNGTAAGGEASGGVPAFGEFSLADLKAATNNFSSENIVSESGEKAPNLVYKGRLQNRRWIAVKKFTKMAWPDPKQFAVCFNFSYFLLVAFVGVAILGFPEIRAANDLQAVCKVESAWSVKFSFLCSFLCVAFVGFGEIRAANEPSCLRA